MNPEVNALQRQLQQLQARHETGTVDAQAYAQARAILERQLVDAVLAGGDAARASSPSLRLWAVLGTTALAVAVTGYTLTGSPALITMDQAAIASHTTGAASAAAAEGGATDAEVAEIVAQMAQRMKERPDDPVGWTLLARAYASMGRIEEAAPAFQRALALKPDDAGLMADYADVLATMNSGNFTPESLRLIERALVLEPDNMKALALSGSVAFDSRDYPTAVRQWEKVERSLPPGNPLLPQVRASIAQARSLGGMPPAAAAQAPGPGPAAAGPVAAAAPSAAAARASAVSGRVSLAPALAAGLNPQDTVFVLARPASGARMPLAVMRLQVKDLPASFTLDDSMAMAPTAKVSDHARVIVVARVSKRGDAMPQPGDLIGQSAPVAPGTSGIAVEIAETVKP